MVWPVATALTMAAMWGIYALLDGVAAISLALGQKEKRWLPILSGVLGIIAGLVIFFQPVTGVVTLGWILGIWLVVRGVLELSAAFNLKETTPKVLLIITGIFWIIGGMVVFTHPGESMINMAFFLGLLAIFWGVSFIVTGFMIRSESKKHTSE